MSSVGLVSAVSSSSSSSSSSSTSAVNSTLSMTFEQYIAIMTAQLKNQDPTNATDPNEYTQELVSILNVQQQTQISQDLQNLVSTFSANAMAQSIGYIGSYAQTTSDDYTMQLQDGFVEFGYKLDAAATGATVSVYDADGTFVTSFDGGTDKGVNYVSWDGKDSSGKKATDGVYTFAVTATGSSGGSVTVSDPFIFAKVTGVQSGKDDTIDLVAGDIKFSTSDVTSVYAKANLPSATPSSTTDTTTTEDTTSSSS